LASRNIVIKNNIHSFFCSRPNFLDELARKRLLRRLFFKSVLKISVRKYGGASTEQKANFLDSHPLRNLLSSNVFCSWYGFPGCYKYKFGCPGAALPPNNKTNMEMSTSYLFFKFFLFVFHCTVEPRLTATSLLRTLFFGCLAKTAIHFLVKKKPR